MVLVADAGNTNIKLAAFNDNILKAATRLPSKITKTPDEFVQDILVFLHKNDIVAAEIAAVIVSTVVPDATKAFLEGIKLLFSMEPLIVGANTLTGIQIKTDNPAELGTDRLVNAAAAFHDYGGPLIVIDFGTATTYNVISEKGEFLGGVIAPGIKISAEALWEKTAMLPRIPIEKPDRFMGTNTSSSMKSGVFYGYLGQVEYIVRHLKGELGTDLKVVATGGYSGVIIGNSDVIDIFEPYLTLKGLFYIYEMNK